MIIINEKVKIIEPEYFTFLYEEPNNGWWLKIDNVNDLVYYHYVTNNRYARTISDYIRNEPQYKNTGRPESFEYALTYAIVQYAEQNNLTIIDAAMQFRLKVASEQLEAIHKYGYIVINPKGGYHPGPIDHSQFVRRKTFTYPNFKESDIRIIQFPNGTHFYVYIGEMELRQDDQTKWMSESDARIAAMKYINKEND